MKGKNWVNPNNPDFHEKNKEKILGTIKENAEKKSQL